MPGPVAIAAQTSSGVPATSISSSIARCSSSVSCRLLWLGVGWNGMGGHDEPVRARAGRRRVVVAGGERATAAPSSG